MSKALLVLAAIAVAYVLWVEYGDQLPPDVTYRPSGDGLDTPSAARIIGGGAGEAAGAVKP